MRIPALVHTVYLAAAVMLPPAALGRPVPQGFTTAAVDRELFRDGEVKRHNERFANWSLDCDEIPRLGQRYCSLRALARDARGVGVADVTVSTDEKGRPAALIGLPLGLDLASPVRIEAAQPLVLGQPSAGLSASTREIAKTSKKAAAARGVVETDILRFALRPALCDAAGCQAALALKPADVAALRAGAGLRIRFSASGRDSRGFGTHGDLPLQPIEAVVTSDGFGQALEASTR